MSTFIQPCFIRKATPELQRTLELLGYTANPTQAKKGRFLLATPSIENCPDGIINDPLYVVVCQPPKCKVNGKSYIDCGKNTELFIAIAALRNDSDVWQWFTTDDHKHWEKSESELPSKFMQMEGHKASVEELIEHFKP